MEQAHTRVYRNGVMECEGFDIAKVSEYLAEDDTMVWIDMCAPSKDELLKLAEELSLHELAVEDARHGHQRPKIEEFGSSLFAVLHNPSVEDGVLSVGEINIFVGPNYILSVRNSVKQGFAAVRERCEREPELLKHGSGFVFYALMDAVVDRYFPLLDALEVDLEGIEERIFSSTSQRANIEDLYALKQKLMKLQYAVVPLLEGVSKLYGGRVPQICVGLSEYYRDVYDHLIRIQQSITSLREMVITAISVNLSMITLQDSQTTKQLAAYAALIGVPTLIAGVYGMNFEHMPELKWLFGYPISLALMLGIDGYLFRRFRKSGWL